MASATEALKEKAGLTKKKPSFMEMLEAMRPQIAMALPRHLTPERMIRVAVTACRFNPKLLECTPESLIAAIMISSQLGLEPGVMGQSFLVPFRHKDQYVCQLIVGWMGIVDLVNRSGKVTAWTGAVYEGDYFEWGLGDQPFLKHRPCGDESKLTHVYAIARPTNSQWPVIEVWPIQKVWDHRNKINKVGEDHYSYKWPEQYARKLPLLQVLKYVSKSIELQAALSLETAAETGGQELQIKDVPNIIEGIGVMSEGEPPAEPQPGKKPAKQEDVMCAECRVTNGHTPDCKFNPRNQLRVAPEPASKTVTESSAETAAPSPQPTAKPDVVPNREENRDTPPSETKPAAAETKPEKAEPIKKLIRVKKVEKKKSVRDTPYYKVSGYENDGTAVTMICWHTNKGLEIYDRYVENGLAIFWATEKHDRAKPYYEIDDIVSLAGKDYRDGKPIPEQQSLADPDDETW